MAERTTPPLPQQAVQVDFDAASFALRATPTELELTAGTRVFWEFSRIPAGFYPWIHFDTSLKAPYGPFRSISQLSSTLMAELPPDSPGDSFTYRLLLRSRVGQRLEDGSANFASPQLRLTIAAPAAERADAPPEISVKPDGTALAVEPAVLRLVSTFQNLVAIVFDRTILEDASGRLEPRIEFLEYTPKEGKTEQSAPFGPFSTLIFDGRILWGSGDAGRRGRYSYRAMALRESTGELVWTSSSDPIIDDDREPPP